MAVLMLTVVFVTSIWILARRGPKWSDGKILGVALGFTFALVLGIGVSVSLGSERGKTSATTSEDQTRCRQEGPRKIVWLESANGSYALNGQAVGLVEKSAASGSPWRDSQGRRVQLGRDVLGLEVTTALIEPGLRKCN